MEIRSLHLQEIIFSSSDSAISREIRALVGEGKLIKIAPRIYTTVIDEDAEKVIRRNLLKIIAHLFPGAQLSHRSAFEYKPTSSGDIFLTYKHARKNQLPGVTLNMVDGPDPLSDDVVLWDGLFVSQPERAMLENLQVSRKPGPSSKTLSLPEIEEKLEAILMAKGESGLNEFRDKARDISLKLGMETEFTKLNKIIGALLNTRSSDILQSSVARARAAGHPYDVKRLQLFESLFTELQRRQFADMPEENLSPQSFRNFAFYEAYFSNFIEGTRFEVEEALEIIETGRPLPARDEDSHDILGTYQLVSNKTEMSITPSSPEELIEILKYRHAILLNARTDKNPGQFKIVNNMAGATNFVDFKLVGGTLVQGFQFYQALSDPFAKAAYMMFMISEIHPFVDGNGRIARLMMNAELVKAKQTRIIIPTVFRIDYLGALRQLTRQGEPDTYIRMLQRAQTFSATLVGEEMDILQRILKESNAFEETEDYILKIVDRIPRPDFNRGLSR